MKYRFHRKIKIILFILPVIIFLFLILWWYKPIAQPDLTLLSDEYSLLQMDIYSPRGAITRQIILDVITPQIRRYFEGNIQLKFAELAVRIFFPNNIKLLVSPKDENSFDYLVALDFGRFSKLFPLFQDKLENKILQSSAKEIRKLDEYRYVQKKSGVPIAQNAIQSILWMDSLLVLSNNQYYLEQILDNYRQQISEIADKSKIERKTKNLVPIKININNQSDYYTQLIRNYEKKLQFEIFKTIDSVKSIEINLVPQNRDKLTTNIIFNSAIHLEENDNLFYDIEYFYEILRRAAHPHGIKVSENSYSIKTDIKENTIELNFELIGLMIAKQELGNIIQ